MARILVIEDQRKMRENIATILTMENYEVVTANDGRSGLAAVGRERPDLVLCDVMMPEMDGYEVLKALRDDPATAALPFIFLTAKGERHDVRSGMNLGADDYLTKPVTVSELLTAVQVRLDRAAHKPAADTASAAAPANDDAECFVREGEFWTIGRGDDVVRIRDGRGLGLLAMLLAEPGREFPCLELDGTDARAVDLGDAGAHLDAAARTDYRRRLQELGDELEEARASNDHGRAERLALEIEAISGELSRGFGLGGRERRAGSAVERARVNVTRGILGAIRKITKLHPRLGRYLTATVRTGLVCVYRPDPAVPLRWKL